MWSRLAERVSDIKKQGYYGRSGRGRLGTVMTITERMLCGFLRGGGETESKSEIGDRQKKIEA